jgi:hypothetical protein
MHLISSILFLTSFLISKSGALPISGFNLRKHKVMVNLRGQVGVSAARVRRMGGIHQAGERPADPTTLLGSDQLEEKAQMVHINTIHVDIPFRF